MAKSQGKQKKEVVVTSEGIALKILKLGIGKCFKP